MVKGGGGTSYRDIKSAFHWTWPLYLAHFCGASACSKNRHISCRPAWLAKNNCMQERLLVCGYSCKKSAVLEPKDNHKTYFANLCMQKWCRELHNESGLETVAISPAPKQTQNAYSNLKTLKSLLENAMLWKTDGQAVHISRSPHCC